MLNPRPSRARRRDPRDTTYPRLYPSRLERRRVLNASAIGMPTDSGETHVDAGSESFDGAADTFQIEIDNTHDGGATVTVSANEQVVSVQPLAPETVIHLEGSSDFDRLILSSMLATGDGITLGDSDRDPGSSSWSAGRIERIDYRLQGDVGSVTVALAADGGSAAGLTIVFSGIEVIDDRMLADQRSFSASDSITTLTVGDLSVGDLSVADASDDDASDDDTLGAAESEPRLRLSSDVGPSISFVAPGEVLTIDATRGASDSGDSSLPALETTGQTLIVSDMTRLDSEFRLTGDSDDTLRIAGDVHLASSDFSASAGDIFVDRALRLSDGDVWLSAWGELRVGEDAVVAAPNGDVRFGGGSIRHDGVITTDGGRVVLDAGDGGDLIVRGSILAIGSETDAAGGTVHLFGNRVGLAGGAVVDVSGSAGGGVALVGGGFQGSDPSARNASRTYVDGSARIDADATIAGDGGTVIVWSDEVTRFYGSISATGAGDGSGGLAEVSGKDSLEFTGNVALGSESGRAGMLLLDPATINITDDVTDNTPQGNVDFGDAGPTTISVGTLENVTADIVLRATHSITIDDLGTNVTDSTINLASGVSLTLETRNAMDEPGGIRFVDAADSIVASGDGDITLIAGSATTPDAEPANLTTIGNLQTADGSISLTASGSADLDGTLTTGGGDIVVTAASGSLMGVDADTGAVTLATGTFVLDAAATIAGDGGLTLDGATLSGEGTVNTDVSMSSSGGAIAPGDTVGDLTVQGAVTFASNGSFDVDITATDNDTLIVDSNNDDINLNGATLNVNASGSLAAGTTIVIINAVRNTSDIVGTFNGLAEGDIVTSGNLAFIITYEASNQDNDVALIVTTGLSIAPDEAVKDEGAEGDTTSLTFTVTRTGDVSGVSTVSYSVSGGDANASDFELGLPSGIVTFLAGETSKTITVNVAGDDVVELDESFTVTLSNPVNGAIATASATGTITNDDSATVSVADATVTEGDSGQTTLSFTLTLSGQVDADVSVQADTDDDTATTSDGDYDAVTGLSVTFASSATPGAQTQTVDVTVNGDAKVELDETLELVLSALSAGGRAVTFASGGDVASGTITNDDSATVSIADVSQAETDGGTTTFTFTVTLSHQVDTTVSLNVDTADDTATVADNDYVAVVAQAVSFGPAGSPGSQTRTVDVTVNGDTKVELDETFDLVMSGLSAGGRDVTLAGDATATISNDDSAQVSVSDVTMDETDSGTVTFAFTVTLSQQVDAAVTMQADTADGTATVADGDYSAVIAQAVSFSAAASAGPQTRTVNVQVAGDGKVELDEAFTLMLSGLSSGGRDVTFAVGGDSGTGNVDNDDSATITVDDVSIDEGDSGTTAFSFTVTLSQQVDVSVTAQADTSDGTATVADGDFTAVVAQAVTFAPAAAAGSQTQTVTVLVNGDTKVELDEAFELVLSALNASGRDVAFQSGGGTQSGTATVGNDDAATVSIGDVAINEGNSGTTTFTFTVSLSSAVDADVTVTADTADDTATVADNDYQAVSGQTVTVSAGSLTQTVDVTVNGDMKAEADEMFDLILSALSAGGRDVTLSGGAAGITATGTIVNDDGAIVSIADVTMDEGDTGTTTFTFTVTLSGAVDTTVTMQADTADGSATTADNDYSAVTGQTLTFAAGVVSQTVSVQVAGDTTVELDEAFQVVLSGLNAGGRDVTFAGGGATESATGTIDNDDAATIDIDDVTMTEGDSGSVTYVFTVTLSGQVDTDVSLQADTADDTASAADGDFTAVVAQAIDFAAAAAPGSQSQTVSVSVNGDTKVELDEMFDVVLSNLNAGGRDVTFAGGGAAEAGSGSILNDDSAVIGIDDVTATEGDAGVTTFSFTVTLSEQVDTTVSVDVDTLAGTASDADGDYVLVNSVLSFAAAATPGAQTRTFDVQVNGDTKVELDEMFQLVLSSLNASGRDVTFAGGGASEAGAATILNDDSATVAIADVVMDEGDSGQTVFQFTVTLSAAVDVDLTMQADTNDGSATVADNDYLALVAQPVTVTANTLTTTVDVQVIGDVRVEGNELFDVVLSALNVSGRDVTFVSGGATETALGTIRNDDAATIDIDDVSIDEGDSGTTTFTFTITMTAQIDETVTVRADSADGTATVADGDYVGATGQVVTFAAGEQVQTLSIQVGGDQKVELDETFFVVLSNIAAGGLDVTFAGGGPTETGTGTVVNDDEATVSVIGASVAEGDAGQVLLTFDVTLSGQVDAAVTAQADTADGSATAADSDYVAVVAQSLTFVAAATPGSQTQSVTVTVNGDTKVELDEALNLVLSSLNASGRDVTFAGGGGTLATSGTIANDDNATITVDDVVITEGDMGQVAYVFTVQLSEQVDTTVSLQADAQDGTATAADGDFDPVVGQGIAFSAAPTPGPQSLTVTVQVNGDTQVELTETFDLVLSNLNAGGRAVTFAGGAATESGVGTIVNDDSATLSVGDVTMLEGDAGQSTFSFSITLSNQVDAAIQVTGDTLDGSATAADGDFTAANGQTVVIAAGTLNDSFDVLVTGDTKVELDEAFSLMLSNLDAGGRAVTFAGGGPTLSAAGTIVNDDQAFITLSPVTQAEGDSGTTAFSFAVNMSAPVDTDVTVRFHTLDGTATISDSDYTAVTASTVTFSAGSTPGIQTETVVVQVSGDTKVEADEFFAVILSALNANGRAVSLAGGGATLSSLGTIDNDDAATIDIDDVTMLEGDSGATVFSFTVTLSAEVDTTVTVQADTVDATATTANSDYLAVTGAVVDFDSGLSQTVNVQVLGDPRFELNEQFIVLLSSLNAGGRDVTFAGGGATESAIGTIVNEDTDIIETGSGGDDTFILNATAPDAGDFTVVLGGVAGPTISFDGTVITSVTFTGLDGDDEMIVDVPSETAFNPVGGIRFDGGLDTGGDALTLQAGSLGSVVHDFLGVGTGTIDWDGVVGDSAKVSYVGVESTSLVAGSVDQLFVNETAGIADDILLSDGAAGVGTARISESSSNFSAFTFTVPITRLEIHAGAGDDFLHVDSSFQTGGAPEFGGDLAIHGDDGTDTVRLSADLVLTDGGLTVESESLQLNADIDSYGGDVQLSQVQTITLLSDVAIVTDDGATSGSDGHDVLASSATIDGAFDLTIDTRSNDQAAGDVRLGDAGNLDPLASLNLFGQEIFVGDAVADGAIELSATSLNLNGDRYETVAGGTITLDGDVLLNGTNVSVISSGAGDIDVFGPIQSGAANASLTLDAVNGDVTLSEDASIDGPLTVRGSSLSVGGDLYQTDGSQDYDVAAVRLTGTGTTTFVSGNNDVLYGGTIDADTAGTQSLVVDAGTGDVLFGADVGGSTRLGGVTVTADLLRILGDVLTDSTGGGDAQIDLSSVRTLDGSGVTSVRIDTDATGGNADAGTILLPAGSFVAPAMQLTLDSTADGSGQSQALTMATVVVDQLTAAAETIDTTGVVTANSVLLTARAGIGDAGAVQLASPSIEATSATGSIAIDNSAGAATTVHQLTTTDGDIVFRQTAAGQLTVTDAESISGAIEITAVDGIVFDRIQTDAVGDAAILLASRGGGIEALDSGSSIDADAGELILQATGGIGDVQAIEIDVDRLQLSNTGAGSSGAIRVNEADSVTVSLVEQEGAGDIVLVAGNVMRLDGTVTASGGAVQFVAGDGSSATVATGGFLMNDGAAVNGSTGTVQVDALGDIQLGAIRTSNDTGAAVSLTSRGGGIVDGGDTHVDVVANSGTLVIDALRGVGVGDAIETQVRSLSVNNDASGATGGVHVDEVGSVIVEGISVNVPESSLTGDAAVQLTAGQTIRVAAAGSGIAALGGGDISLSAGGDLVIADTASADDLLVNGDGRIRGSAAGSVISLNSPVVRTATGYIQGVLPTITVTPVDIGGGVNVDDDGNVSVEVFIDGGTNYVITVDWMDFPGQDSRFQFPPTDNSGDLGNGSAVGGRYDGDVVHRFDYQYILGNPTGSAAQDIPYFVGVSFDYRGQFEPNGIQFFSAGSPLTFSTPPDAELQVPAQGITSIAVVTPPEPERIVPLVVQPVDPPPSSRRAAVEVSDSIDLEDPQLDIQTVQGQRVELRVVTPSGEEITVYQWIGKNTDIINQRQKLFQDLPDDRYRMYLILEDGTQQQIFDVFLRNHKPYDPLDRGDTAPAKPDPPASDTHSSDDGHAATVMETGAGSTLVGGPSESSAIDDGGADDGVTTGSAAASLVAVAATTARTRNGQRETGVERANRDESSGYTKGARLLRRLTEKER